MKTNNKPRPDVYQMVTDRIIAALEKDIVPWKQPWRESGPPRNLITGHVYRGINFWLLMSLSYPQNFFLSYKQLKELGGKVKEGEKPNMIVFWKPIQIDDPETDEKKQYTFLRYYMVYNVDQVEGLGDSKEEIDNVDQLQVRSCEEIVQGMPKCPVIKHKEARAYYNPLKDFINMPPQHSFDTPEGYYGTLFHELVHSTGHQSRLARKELLQMAEFGSDPYSVEELTAEIGACYLKSIANLDNDPDHNHAYIQGWLAKLKNDSRFIVYASIQAQKATDFILNALANDQSELVADEVTD